jgi:hypothetical protein
VCLVSLLNREKKKLAHLYQQEFTSIKENLTLQETMTLNISNAGVQG